MRCKEICSKYFAENPDLKNRGRYESGHKRCSNCEIYIVWGGERCPCCSSILRVKPRNSKSREKISNLSK